MNNTLERYKKLEVKGSKDATLGEGAYGVVYKALDTVLDKHVALKKIKLETEEEGIPTTALREMTLLRHLDHPNVVKLENVIMDPGRLYLVFELVDTDLKKLMDSADGPFSPNLVQSYTAQLLAGIAHCHLLGIMHRDLKPQNILMSSEGVLKIADFGLARCFTPHAKPLTVEVITRWYRAPEIMLGSNVYTSAVDLWSVGCIVVEMANRRAFLPGDSEIDQIFRIFRVFGTPYPQQWPQLSSLPYWKTTFPEWQPMNLRVCVPSLPPLAINLLERLFVYNPVDRISAQEALDHPFVEPIHRQQRELHEQQHAAGMMSPSSATGAGKGGPGSGVALTPVGIFGAGGEFAAAVAAEAGLGSAGGRVVPSFVVLAPAPALAPPQAVAGVEGGGIVAPFDVAPVPGASAVSSTHFAKVTPDLSITSNSSSSSSSSSSGGAGDGLSQTLVGSELDGEAASSSQGSQSQSQSHPRPRSRISQTAPTALVLQGLGQDASLAKSKGKRSRRSSISSVESVGAKVMGGSVHKGFVPPAPPQGPPRKRSPRGQRDAFDANAAAPSGTAAEVLMADGDSSKLGNLDFSLDGPTLSPHVLRRSARRP